MENPGADKFWGEAKVQDLKFLIDILPPVISRKHVEKYLGGLVTSKTLANHDAAGMGPRVRIETRHGVMYPTIFLLEWIERKGTHIVTNPDDA